LANIHYKPLKEKKKSSDHIMQKHVHVVNIKKETSEPLWTLVGLGADVATEVKANEKNPIAVL